MSSMYRETIKIKLSILTFSFFPLNSRIAQQSQGGKQYVTIITSLYIFFTFFYTSGAPGILNRNGFPMIEEFREIGLAYLLILGDWELNSFSTPDKSKSLIGCIYHRLHLNSSSFFFFFFLSGILYL